MPTAPPTNSAEPSPQRFAHAAPAALTPDVAHLGQVFTPPNIVEHMLGLIRNRGRVLDPACGDGAFSERLAAQKRQVVAIEFDDRFCPAAALNQDFFAYPEKEKFATIIGNPPYVKARDILPQTALRLGSSLLNGHANLYCHFIEKCVRHLKPGGELIFITPRDFLKATGAARLNTWLYDQGSFTDMIELGDARVFSGAMPNCIIWRFEKDNLQHRLNDRRHMRLVGGQLTFTHGIYSVPLASVFSVRVGAVSGADSIYTHAELGNADFVCSHTAQTGELRRMIFPEQLHNSTELIAYLEQFKPRLLARRVARFDESNWWRWGRLHHISDAPRIYVNGKTRKQRPFFLNACNNYDGSILALFPHRTGIALEPLVAQLNDVNWSELGFVCDGRFLFSQRSLEQSLLPEDFAVYAKTESARVGVV
ncbi:MAG: class I SAM-dependent methyltransferase [Betaproteobacteria bacterium]|nr:class I SAM-dependent methyltransferase [Betaproteobacteria bacterium]